MKPCVIVNSKTPSGLHIHHVAKCSLLQPMQRRCIVNVASAAVVDAPVVSREEQPLLSEDVRRDIAILQVGSLVLAYCSICPCTCLCKIQHVIQSGF